MKKLLLLVAGAVGAAVAVKQAKSGNEETARWAELVDSVKQD